MPQAYPSAPPVYVRAAGASSTAPGSSESKSTFGIYDDATTALALVADGTGGPRSGRDAADLTIDTCARIYRGRQASVLDDLAEVWWKGEHGAEAGSTARPRPYSALPIADRVELRDRVRRLLEHRVPDALGDVSVLEEETRMLLTMPARALQTANGALFRLAERETRWGSLTAQVACVIFGAGQVSLAHVGHGRVSRIRRRSVEALTEEHTLAYEYRSAGRPITPEQIAALPAAVVTRSVGMRDSLDPSCRVLPLELGDVFVLSNDRVLRTLSPSDVLTSVRAHGTAAAADLVERARSRSGRAENLTIVVAEVVGASPSAAEA